MLLAPATVALAAALVARAPWWLLAVLGLASLVPRHFRLPRVLWMLTFYLLWEAAALVAMFVLWVASGAGWHLDTPAFRRAHYALAGVLLRILFWQARRVLRLRIRVMGDAPERDAPNRDAPNRDAPASPLAPGRPLIVASRHAGPGDSFILVHLLINRFRREPRIVLVEALQWDPAVDVLLHRLPNRFIVPTRWSAAGPGRGPAPGESRWTAAQEVGALARGLGGNGAMLIFPEGGKFTKERKFRRIERLMRSGWTGHARRAAALSHVLAPQPGGMLAALDAAPDADVVFIGHTGLEGMATLSGVWRDLPLDKRIVIQAWHVPHADIPHGTEARNEWLFTWFERIDGWIGSNQPLA
ncbi:acyltransferase [Zafaria cholistanensis]|uniref:Acyltransferase n=1 Tax=Zafaria cholistanensis TaxID=1682741 RepID=A0A5A7NQ03_9MICC|nr:1-acyl-sn-glycerol-3-phosphate acyltransferase [Zafaria cholistanensis]GER22825.1 acyltransferase [Zafaria cholistanensis]